MIGKIQVRTLKPGERSKGICPYCHRRVQLRWGQTASYSGAGLVVGRHKIVNRLTLGASEHCAGEGSAPI